MNKPWWNWESFPNTTDCCRSRPWLADKQVRILTLLANTHLCYLSSVSKYSALYFTVARPAALSWILRVSIPGAFLRPAGGGFHIENLNSSVYDYLANLQLQQSHTLLTVSRGCSSWTTVILYGFNFKSVVAFRAENCETPVSEIFSGYVLTFVLSHPSFSSIST